MMSCILLNFVCFVVPQEFADTQYIIMNFVTNACMHVNEFC